MMPRGSFSVCVRRMLVYIRWIPPIMRLRLSSRRVAIVLVACRALVLCLKILVAYFGFVGIKHLMRFAHIMGIKGIKSASPGNEPERHGLQHNRSVSPLITDVDIIVLVQTCV